MIEDYVRFGCIHQYNAKCGGKIQDRIYVKDSHFYVGDIHSQFYALTFPSQTTIIQKKETRKPAYIGNIILLICLTGQYKIF